MCKTPGTSGLEQGDNLTYGVHVAFSKLIKMYALPISMEEFLR